MKKTMFLLSLLTVSCTNGMYVLNDMDSSCELDTHIGDWCRDTYYYVPTTNVEDASIEQSDDKILLPAYCLPEPFAQQQITGRITANLSHEGYFLLVETMAQLKLFPHENDDNKEQNVALFKKKLKKFRSSFSTKTELWEFYTELDTVIGHFCLPALYQKEVCGPRDKLFRKPKWQVKGGYIKVSVDSAVDEEEDTPLQVTTGSLARKLTDEKKRKNSGGKKKRSNTIANLLSSAKDGLINVKHHSIVVIKSSDDTAYDFPVYRGFLQESFCKKIDDMAESTIPGDAERVYLPDECKKFSRRVLSALVPLLIDYHVLLQRKKTEDEIVATCAEAVTEAFLTLAQYSAREARLFLDALDFFELKLLARFCRKLNPHDVLLGSANRGSSYGVTISSREEAQVLIRTIASKSNVSLPLLVHVSNVISRMYQHPQIKELNKALALENIKSVMDSEEIISGKIVPLTLEPVAEKRITIAEYLVNYLNMQLNPTAEYKRQVALNFLQTNKPYLFQQGVLDKQSWQDLELFCGSKKSPYHSTHTYH